MKDGLRRIIFTLGLAGTAWPASAQVVVPQDYGVTYDSAAHSFDFTVRFDRQPDFVTMDEYGRMADQLQYWLDTEEDVNAQLTAAQRLAGWMPSGVQSMLLFNSIPTLGTITLVRLDPAGPPQYGGWQGEVVNTIAYTLDADHTLRFRIQQGDLSDADGKLSWAFETYNYGGWGGVTYSSQAPQVPEPSAWQALCAGLAFLAVAGRRRSKPDLRQPMVPPTGIEPVFAA